MSNEQRILWADDEIDLLKPHILFLQTKGYRVTSVTNGTDAVEEVRKDRFDMVFLDEQMPGKDGIETLTEIKAISPELPVVMITKSEEEHLMEDAIGGKISDYLTKPVNPSQILLTCKRLLDRKRIRGERVSQKYLQTFNQITMQLMNPLAHDEWAEVYKKLVGYDIELEGDETLREILLNQFHEANREFGKFVENLYPQWIRDSKAGIDSDARPVLSHELLPDSVFPLMQEGKPVYFLLIDCMRYDQWLEIEKHLYSLFNIDTKFYYSILPTATPYSRNAIFSGMLPDDIQKKYPQYWKDGEDDEFSRNRNEETFLQDLMDRLRIGGKMKYDKILTTHEGRTLSQNIRDYDQNDLNAIVVNFVDILTHSRSDSDVLKEIAPDERAFRALTRTWFEHSWLLQTFDQLAAMNATIVVSTDHGAIRSMHASKVIGDRETSTCLRYKYGRNIKSDDRHAIHVKDPKTYGLPVHKLNTNYIIAKEDYYFVYPTNYHHYLNLYRDTMQHGGASMEEMILPIATLRPKK